MSGAFNQPASGRWKTFEKRGGTGTKFSKYDTVLRVIVSGVLENGKEPKDTRGSIYLSKLAADLLGNPDHIHIYEDGELIAFGATTADDPDGYAYHAPWKKEGGEGEDIGRKFLSARAIITKHDLRPGVYEASKEISKELGVIIFFNSKSNPSEM